MIKEDRYLTMRHLEAYSEIKLARFLEGNGFTTFFPFKDKIGVDMVAVKNSGDEIELYQLKARNKNEHHKLGEGTYWFGIEKDIQKLSKLKDKNVFFIFCALQDNQKDFDFFKVPLNVAIDYINQKKKTNKQATDFEIKKESNGNYKLMPYHIKNININNYILK